MKPILILLALTIFPNREIWSQDSPPLPSPEPRQPRKEYVLIDDEYYTGEWQIVCQNLDCGATNVILPTVTNKVVTAGLGGRIVTRWFPSKCPVCKMDGSNFIGTAWVVDVMPIPVKRKKEVKNP